MRGFIYLLSFVTVLFAAYTVWVDPTIGPQVQAMLPEGMADLPTLALGPSGGGTPTADGTYGGVGAANRVAGGVAGGIGGTVAGAINN